MICNNNYLSDIQGLLNKGFNLGDAFSKSLKVYVIEYYHVDVHVDHFQDFSENN